MIYLISTACKQFTKIGVTGNRDARSRVRQLQTGSPLELYLHATYGVADDYAVERAAHLYFEKYRTVGEWFVLSPEHVVAGLDARFSLRPDVSLDVGEERYVAAEIPISRALAPGKREYEGPRYFWTEKKMRDRNCYLYTVHDAATGATRGPFYKASMGHVIDSTDQVVLERIFSEYEWGNRKRKS